MDCQTEGVYWDFVHPGPLFAMKSELLPKKHLPRGLTSIFVFTVKEFSMSRRVIVSMFAVLFVAAFATFASAQDATETATTVADDAAVVAVAPCVAPCYASCCNPCYAPCRPPRVFVDPCSSVVYRRGLFGCYRPVCPPPVVVCDPCCPPVPRYYRGYRAAGCCW